jgi:hypothetical protein
VKIRKKLTRLEKDWYVLLSTQFFTLIPNMMFILHNNWLLMEKSEICRQNFELFVRHVEKMDIYSKKIILEKKRFVFLFAFKWYMTIREKFHNQRGDRFARRGSSCCRELNIPSNMLNTNILCFETKRYTDGLTFLWGIRIYQIWKITVNGKGKIWSFLRVMQIFCFLGTVSILRISSRKLDRIRIKR